MSDEICESSGLVIIDSTNVQKYCPQGGTVIDGEVCSTGLKLSDIQDVMPECCEPWPHPDIPRDEWKERIDEYREQKRSVKHFYDRFNVPSLHQNGTNYCHTNAVINCAISKLMKQGHGHVALSPASVAAPFLNYQNEGSLGRHSLQYFAEHGACETKFWPPNAINRKYDNEESRANRKLYVPSKFWILPNRFEAKMTALIMGIELACGYYFWLHEIMAAAPWYKIEGGRIRYGSEELNSHGDTWPRPGARGWGVLEERQSGDLMDCCAIAQMKPLAV
jgi:hypothetical protein